MRRNFRYVKRKLEKANRNSEKKITFADTKAYKDYHYELNYIKIEVNKVLSKPTDSPVDLDELFEKFDDEDKYDS
jgi:hypothetical protein